MSKTLKIILFTILVLVILGFSSHAFTFMHHGFAGYGHPLSIHGCMPGLHGFFLFGAIGRLVMMLVPLVVLALAVWAVVELVRRDGKKPAVASPVTPAPRETAANSPLTCAHCGKDLSQGWVACPHCGEKI